MFAAAAAAVLARAGLAGSALGGAAVGCAIGALYLWLLVRRAATLPGLPPRRALVAAQAAAVLRFGFVFVGFAVATRLWPGANLGWGAGAFFLPVAVGIVVQVRGG